MSSKNPFIQDYAETVATFSIWCSCCGTHTMIRLGKHVHMEVHYHSDKKGRDLVSAQTGEIVRCAGCGLSVLATNSSVLLERQVIPNGPVCTSNVTEWLPMEAQGE